MDLNKDINFYKKNQSDYQCVSPHPNVLPLINKRKEKINSPDNQQLHTKINKQIRTAHLGLDDGFVIPFKAMPIGISTAEAQNYRLEQMSLSGTVRILIVLLNFPDVQIKKPNQFYENLFFSKNNISTGSVCDYYNEVSNGLVEIQGEVIGPFMMPNNLAFYANGATGRGAEYPNAATMAKHAAIACENLQNLKFYDNDNNGFVDGFVLIHAGEAAEEDPYLDPNKIWSHKWILEGGPHTALDGTKINAYLTVAEDCKIGVCAHELGHLLFGLPDLYDEDNSSMGIGNWCLMSLGSWNGVVSGNTPSHLSAWCKYKLGWVKTEIPSAGTTKIVLEDVKQSSKIIKLWKKNSKPAKEYFLLEYRIQAGFDMQNPGSGLLIWHIDESVNNNSDSRRYLVALLQADGQSHLEKNKNYGDDGDPYPGLHNNRLLNKSTNPNSKSNACGETGIEIKIVESKENSIILQITIQ